MVSMTHGTVHGGAPITVTIIATHIMEAEVTIHLIIHQVEVEALGMQLIIDQEVDKRHRFVPAEVELPQQTAHLEEEQVLFKTPTYQHLTTKKLIL